MDAECQTNASNVSGCRSENVAEKSTTAHLAPPPGDSTTGVNQQQRVGATPPLLLCHEPTETHSPETNERVPLSADVHRTGGADCHPLEYEGHEWGDNSSSQLANHSSNAELDGGWQEASRQSPLSIIVAGSERSRPGERTARLERKKRRPLRKTSPDLHINMNDFRAGPLPPSNPTIAPYRLLAHCQVEEDAAHHRTLCPPTTQEERGGGGMDQQPPSQQGNLFSRSLLNHYVTPLTTLRGGGTLPPTATGQTTIEARMVQQLRDLICQFDWAQVHMKHVQRKYFDKQYKAMERGWDALDAAIDEFHKQRSEEHARIAAIRSTLAEERRRLTERNDAERVERLEGELGRLKRGDAQKSRLVAELRTKVNSLEGVRKAFEESSEKNLKALKETQARLTRAETENSNLRVKLSMMKERSSASSSSANNSGSLNASAPSLLPLVTSTPRAGRDSPLFHVVGTPAARKSFAATTSSSSGGGAPTNTSSGQESVRWSSPLAAAAGSSWSPPQVSLHQLVGGGGMVGSWPTSPYTLIDSNMINTKYEVTRRGIEYTFTNGPQVALFTELHCHCTLYEYNNGDFRWVGRVGQRVQVYYYEAGDVYEIRTPRGSKILFFLGGQLEVHWRVGDSIGDRTVIMPGGKRIEVYQQHPKRSEAGLRFEVFDRKRAYRWCENDEAPMLFEPDTNRMSKRADGSFVSVVEDNSLQIKAPDFVLRRLDSGFVKISFGEVCLQVSLCPCNVFVVKHVVEKSDGGKRKCVCYARGSCAHINPSHSTASSTSLLSSTPRAGGGGSH